MKTEDFAESKIAGTNCIGHVGGLRAMDLYKASRRSVFTLELQQMMDDLLRRGKKLLKSVKEE